MPKNIATREDWLNLGLTFFNKKGEAALVVEKMAKSLGVSKTSYYWHFKTRDHFLLELAEHWVKMGTISYIKASKKYQSDREKLFQLTKEVFIQGHNLNSIRFWRDLSKESNAIEDIVKNVELQRIEYIQSLLASDFDNDEARNRADMLYHYFLGWSERHRGIFIDEGEFDMLWKNIIEPIVNPDIS
ncbi:hypothetical protein MNBD_GAMMA18-637 [hydrothermal vent metagenome]|uniref:HTH tetR-type domain-containing protein n=1 Tax=hydrothermal vent metagenome TaxID=652676 RepID=A0A3B0ZPJ1_9ZZZZ